MSGGRRVPLVPFWRTRLGSDEIRRIAASVRAGHVTQGPVVAELEKRLAEILEVPYVVATTSGSAALYMAVAALGIGPGDEVIVPDRTFIATAHAVLLAGARVRLVDARADAAVIDENLIERAVTPRTKAIIPVHLNGTPANMRAIRRIARRRGLRVIEDAAQAFYSRDADGFLGTRSDVGCFSLGITKLITAGQGGFLAVRNRTLYEKLSRFRTHGVVSTFSAPSYDVFGFNLRFNDVLASIGLVQLGRLKEKIRAHARVHDFYTRELASLRSLTLVPLTEGQVPLYIEALCPRRDRLVALLEKRGVQARPFLPSLHKSPHLRNRGGAFPHSARLAAQGLFLPCGPGQDRRALEKTVAALRALDGRLAEAT